MDYSAERTEDDLSQIADFVGTWDADLSGMGDEYADTELYTVIGEVSHAEYTIEKKTERLFSHSQMMTALSVM